MKKEEEYNNYVSMYMENNCEFHTWKEKHKKKKTTPKNKTKMEEEEEGREMVLKKREYEE